MHDDETFRVDDEYTPRKKNTGCWVAMTVIGLFGAGVVAMFGCCGGLAWLGFSIQKEEIVEDLRGNPVLGQHVGHIRESEIVWIPSLDAPEDDYVIDVVGVNGSGRLRVTTTTGDDDTLDVVAGTVETPDGTRHDLFPEAAVDE